MDGRKVTMEREGQINSNLEQDVEENRTAPPHRLNKSTGVALLDSEVPRTIKLNKRKNDYNVDDCTQELKRSFTHSFPPAHFAKMNYNLIRSSHSAMYAFNAGVCITDALPESVLSKCLFDGYLNTGFVLRALSCVSKTLCSIARETVRMLDLRRLSMKVENVQNMVSRFQNLSSLDLNHCSQFSDNHLTNLLPLQHSLTILRLRGTAVTDRGVVDFFSNVNASESSMMDRGGLSSCWCRLEELDLSATTPEGSLHIGDAAIDAITVRKSIPMICSAAWM